MNKIDNLINSLTTEDWTSLLVGWDLPTSWRVQKAPKIGRYRTRDALWFDFKFTQDFDPLLGGEEFYIDLYLRKNCEFDFRIKSASGSVSKTKLTPLDRIQDLNQLCMVLQQISSKSFCLGVLGNDTELPYEHIAEWKRVEVKRYKGRLFSPYCDQFLEKNKTGRPRVRCQACDTLRMKLKSYQNFEKETISARVKQSYKTPVIPTEEEIVMITEAESWVASNPEALETAQMSSLTYGSNELFLEALNISRNDNENKQRNYSEGYLQFAGMVRELLGSSKYQSLRGFNIIPLPCLRTIDRWFAPTHYPLSIDDDVLEQLDRAWKDLVKEIPQAARLGHLISLSIDEIDLKRGLMWRGQRLFGEVREPDTSKPLISLDDPLAQLAPSGMLFVLRSCIYDQFRFPLCIFGVEGHPVGSSIAEHWSSVINPLRSSGYTVRCISSDGVRGSKEARKTVLDRFGIASYPDPAHLLKSLWKLLLKTSKSTNLWTPYGDANVTVLHACLAKSNSFLSVGARISECCLNPTTSQKMSVRLPLQVFSDRMIAILETLENEHKPGTLFYLKLVQGWWQSIADRRIHTEELWNLKRGVLQEITGIFRDWMEKAHMIRELRSKNHTNRELLSFDIETGITSIIPKPEHFQSVLAICDFWLTGPGAVDLQLAWQNNGTVRPGCRGSDINEHFFSLFRSTAGASSNVTLAHCLVVLRRLQLKENLLITEHDAPRVTRKGNVPLLTQRHHSNARIKLKGGLSKKRTQSSMSQPIAIPEKLARLGDLQLVPGLKKTDLLAAHHLMSAALRSLTQKLKIAVPRRPPQVIPVDTLEQATELYSKVFAEELIESDEEDIDFLPDGIEDDQSDEAFLSPVSSPISASESPASPLSVSPSPVSPSHILPSSPANVPPAVVSSTPINILQLQSSSSSCSSDTSIVLTSMIATSNESATAFSSFSLLLEHIPGSFILIERTAFNTFYIPLARVLTAMTCEITSDLRPALTFLRTHSSLQSLFYSLFSSDLLPVCQALYPKIAEAAFRNFFGGGVLPVLTRRIRAILKSSKKNKKQSEQSEQTSTVLHENQITASGEPISPVASTVMAFPSTTEPTKATPAKRRTSKLPKATPKATDQSVNVRKRLKGYENNRK